MPAASEMDLATTQTLLAPLSNLSRVRKGSNDYYVPMLSSNDPYLEFGAYCQILRSGVLPETHTERLVALCRHGGLKQRAFQYFQARFETTLARRVADAQTSNVDRLISDAMHAELAFDDDRNLTACIALFFESGSMADLLKVAEAAGRAGGWQAAVEWDVRGAAIFPLEPLFFHRLLHELAEANQVGLVEDVCAKLGRAGLHPYVREVYSAGVVFAKGDLRACVDRLSKLPALSPAAPRILTSVLARAKKTLGDAYDRLGQYREAYGSYAEMNRLEQSPTVVPMAWDNPKSGPRFWQTLTANAPTLPPAQRSDVVMLLGFARSGTTLLENVLDSHPDIEAFEEVPAWDAAFALLRPQWLGEGVARPNKSEQLRAAQVTYFREIEQRRKKTGASFVVDKNPLRGLHAAPLIKMIPDQKYIFCIRHPFDVVLSCFRQRFDPNPATENFRTLKGTSDYYDLAMSQWFEYFTLANPLVHYLRYDDLVTNFEATVRGALDFIGVPWNDAVRSFSDTSQKRTAETPSYAKIRQGLSIGVQTYWKDYRFLFDTPDTAPLHKWAKHFKYDTA